MQVASLRDRVSLHNIVYFASLCVDVVRIQYVPILTLSIACETFPRSDWAAQIEAVILLAEFKGFWNI